MTIKDWRFALDYFHGACAYCGHSASLFDRSPTLHQEHYIAMTNGGEYTRENIIPSCQQCNNSKRDLNPIEWVTSKFGAREAKKILKRINDYFESIKDRV